MTRFSALAAALALGAALLPAAAGAHGTVRVQQRDHTVQVYPGVTLRRIGETEITVTSPDGKDTMILDEGACTYVGDLLRCYLSGAQLRKRGTTTPLDFNHGTLYANVTNTAQPLTHSSQSLPPNGLLAALESEAGTYISITGTIDGVAK